MRRTVPWIVTGGVLLLVSNARGGAWAPATKLANAGDSISQGFAANGNPSDHPELSWVQGTDARISSLFTRYATTDAAFEREPESVSGAEMVSGHDNFAAQASRICAQQVLPTRVEVLLGGNDVCNRARSSSADAAANMYSVGTWRQALRAGLDQLAACLPPGAVVQVLSMPRVDYLYEAGHAKSWWCGAGVWPMANVCRVVTAETDAFRRRQIGARIDLYNAVLAAEVEAYASNANGMNERGVGFMTDWQGSLDEGHAGTSVGTFRISGDDINSLDCFHPNVGCQARFACVAWATGPDGNGSASACLAR